MLEIREAEFRDLAQILRMQHDWRHEDHTWAYEPGGFCDLLEHLGPYFLSLEFAGELVGYS